MTKKASPGTSPCGVSKSICIVANAAYVNVVFWAILDPVGSDIVTLEYTEIPVPDAATPECVLVNTPPVVLTPWTVTVISFAGELPPKL